MRVSHRNLLAKLLIVLMVITMLGSYWTVTAKAEDNKGQDVISLYPADYIVPLTEDTEGLVFKIPVNLESKDKLQELIDQGKIKLEFNRDMKKPYSDFTLFPNQKMGGLIEEWKTQQNTPMFANLAMTPREEEGKLYLDVKTDVKTYFADKNGVDFSTPHSNGGAYLDICGYFNLDAKADDAVVGTVPTKIVPYDKFHTMDEMYKGISKLANTQSDLYVEEFSMGSSTGGRNMPYLVIADKKESVDQWLKFTNDAETDPEAALAAIKAGKTKDLKVPILFSNVHANEVAASDGIMDFAWKLVNEKSIDYKYLTGFTKEGKETLEAQMGAAGAEGSIAIPDLVKEKASYLGFIKGGTNWNSTVVDLEKYYNIDNRKVNVDELLDNVFFVIVPEENVDGRTFITRTGENGYDFNRDNAFQTTNETANMQHIIGKFNPVSMTEFHGRVKSFQCEPCDPPHEPNFEYDILSRHLMEGGEALGIAAIANNKSYNSYSIPMRDYLNYTGKKTADNKDETFWEDPWDDMSTSYTPQFAMLHGTLAYTVELPAYSDDTTLAASYGMVGQSKYIADNKVDYIKNQVEIFKRGVTNHNSDAYEEVGQWHSNQYDIEGAEAELFRPEFKGEGENGNFYPEAYIIPMAGQQKDLQSAKEMLTWLGRNDVKVNFAEKPFTVGGKTYPAGTAVVSMYQAKRSVANGVLYDGTYITTWTVLYSEGITAFNKTRGFDMEKVTKPADFEIIKKSLGEPQDYEGILGAMGSLQGDFEGKQKADVIIYNTSLAAVEAVNALLKEGQEVGMITEGDLMGNFICSNEAYELAKTKYNYLFKAKGLYGSSSNIVAKKIKKPPQVYVVGKPGQSSSGFIDTLLLSSAYDYNYDRRAMELMGFHMTQDLAVGDVIIGASDLTKDASALTAVQSSKPYMGYSRRNGKLGAALFDGAMERTAVKGMDLFTYVTYPDKTLVNASYINKEDPLFYGYGVGYFSKVPEGAKILVKTKEGSTPIEGFIPEKSDSVNTLLNDSIQGFEYTTETMDVVIFANTLTNKVHQRDEYAYISNFIFSRTLGDAYTAFATEPPENPVDDPQPGEGEEYKIIKGANSIWTKGTKEGLLIASDAPFDKFADVVVDGNVLKIDKDYKAASGSTEITLDPRYLEGLAVGNHNITIKSSDGQASTQFMVKEMSSTTTAAKTGDRSNMTIYIILIVIAISGGLAIFLKKKEDKNKNK